VTMTTARAPKLKIDGWVVLDKSAGMTSTQAVSRLRRLARAEKAGHAGTLDPLATGVLPIAFGEATKTVPYVQDAAKRYSFVVRWGEERTTDDAEGEVVDSASDRPAAADIAAALGQFIGAIAQTPPRFSAIKLDGERAYTLARRGLATDLQPRPVRVDSFELMECLDADAARFEVKCGKGTYVRALARDLGRKLGCFGHVTQLRRTQVGPFAVTAAFSLDKLAELWHISGPSEHLLPVETALVDIPALALTGVQAERLRQGQSVRVLRTADGTVCVTAAGRPVALAEVAAGEVRPVRVFNL
jgi:tRNA pseudouridine55 synthase